MYHPRFLITLHNISVCTSVLRCVSPSSLDPKWQVVTYTIRRQVLPAAEGPILAGVLEAQYLLIDVGEARADIISLEGNPQVGIYLLVNASHPFVLVFSQEYDPILVAEVNGAPVPRQDHFVVYGYANGWLVNSTGILRIYVYYAPQLALERLYAISFAISIIILGASALFLKKRLFT